MVPVVSFVGWSKAGKTTLIEEIIKELKKHQYKVAVIKHTAHKTEFDTAGKDTWRFKQAGSDIMALSSSNELVLLQKVDGGTNLNDIRSLIGNKADIILVEGYKSEKLPKIEVRLKGSAEQVSKTSELAAIVCDEPLNVQVPQFKHSQAGLIADFIIKNFIRILPGSN